MVTIRPIETADRPTVRRIQVDQWGEETAIAHGVAFRPAELDGFLALEGDVVVGIVTYLPYDDGITVEVITVDALKPRSGIGTLLMDAVATRARSLGAQRLVLTTTNDNVDALRFYQRRGFALCALRPGQLDVSRKLKPEIPMVGNYGIPLTDELELERSLTD